MNLPDPCPPRINPATLAAATQHFPTWLAADIAGWVTAHEERGHRYTTALVAVTCALEEIGARR